MAAAAVSYPRGLARLSIDSTSTMSSGASGPVSSSPSASSSSSSPPVHKNSLSDTLMTDGVATKIEDLDNDDELRNVPPLPSPTESGEPSKRGRGRPRKHPLPPMGIQTKVTKGRSKTGCITCRRRKKKCDEMKPECNNCIKNAVVCEGYPEKTVWQSGRQKAEGESAHRTFTPNDRLLTPFTGRFNPSVALARFTELPCLIDGVETRIDRALLDHFVRNVSRILTLFNDSTNPFQEMLLPLALENRGLMHSLLCLSGSHLSNTDPSYSVAQHHHFGKAMQYLRCDPAVTGQIPIAGDPTIATTLILCLNSICKGETEGEYRPHLDAARHMLAFANSGNNKNINPSFSNFLYEFFMYHDVINSVTTLDRRPLLLMENYTLPAFIIQPEAGALLGVLDGLFGYLSKITLLRDQIRGRKARGDHPPVDYEVLSQAVAIDSEIRDWIPAQTPGSHRYIAAQLYRQSTWVYLYRTIMPSIASPKIDVAVEEGLEYLRHLPENSGTQSILLMPLFILGCAAFNPNQRPEISQRFVGLHEYSGLGNIVTAHEVVKKVWDLMDSGEDEKSWDWEKIIQEMGYDFLVT